MNYQIFISTLLTFITVLIGYGTLVQKSEEVGRSRPLLRVFIRPKNAGVDEVVICNDGNAAAMALTANFGGDYHVRDVLKAGDEFVIERPSLPRLDLKVTYRGTAGPPCASERQFERDPGGAMRLVSGADRRLGFIKRTLLIGRNAA